MRWPIRRQILWPFSGVVALSVAVLTAAAAARAARLSEENTRAQLHKAVETLARLNVPYTNAVLQHMRGLSGAHFVACDATGAVTASTLPPGADFTQATGPSEARGDLQSLGATPTLVVGGARYYAARIEPRAQPGARALYVLLSEQSWARSRREAALPPLIVGGLTLALTSIVSVWLAERFSRRLRQLQERVAGIAAGDFRAIPIGNRQDEIQDLALSVNRMAEKLQFMQEAIRRSERTRLLAQLAGGLAHQLRNAVTGARIALQLHGRRCTAATADQSLAVALRQLSLTEVQVKGLLSLGRGERRPVQVCCGNDLLTEIEPLLEPACEHAGVRLMRCNDPHETLHVSVDVEGLRSAVLNLSLNAIEAAGAMGVIQLGARRDDAQVVIEVADCGPGPADEISETLFEPFVTTKAEGTGLGLALARQVACDHGGTLRWLRIEGRTVFRLSLPAAEVAAEPRQTAGPTKLVAANTTENTTP